MLDGVDIAYWINLDRSNDRRDNMNAMFQDDVFKHIKNERFPAIDYKENNVMDWFNLNKSDNLKENFILSNLSFCLTKSDFII